MRTIRTIISIIAIIILSIIGVRYWLSGEIFGVVDPVAQEMTPSFYSVTGGEIEIKDGTWQFVRTGVKSFECTCVFTILNNSRRTYNVLPAPYLYDEKGNLIYSPFSRLRPQHPFKLGARLKPGESHSFTGKFTVPWEIASKTNALEIRGGFAEIK